MSEKVPLLDQDEKVFPEVSTSTSAQNDSPIVSFQQYESYHRLLATFFKHKRSVSNTPGLFRAENSKFFAGLNQEQQRHRISEKRWSVYLARAVHRFEVWWQACVPNSSLGTWPFGSGIARETKDSWSHGMDMTMEWKEEDMLPLDVFMVFHVLTLHSRSFLGDCIRHHKMSIWNSDLPLNLIDRYIDHRKFIYSPPETTRQNFERRTGLSWDNVNDPDTMEVECFRCRQAVRIPWTTRREMGYADTMFLQLCLSCNYSMDRLTIPTLSFRKDLLSLLETNVPMRGTSYIPPKGGGGGVHNAGLGVTSRDTYARTVFPNVFFRDCLASVLLEETRFSNLFPQMKNIVGSVADAVKDQRVIQKVRETTMLKSISNIEISALHHVLSRYDHAGSFSCNLHSATLQFSGFLENMRSQLFRWIQSPAMLSSILEKNTGRYKNFLIQKHKGKASAGPSEVDTSLVFLWHAHRAMPSSYYKLSIALTRGELVDDDDDSDDYGYDRNHNAAECPLCSAMLPSFQPLKWLDRFFNFVDGL